MNNFTADSTWLTITAKSVDKLVKSSRVSFIIKPLPVKSRTDFCNNYLERVCFWDSVTYSVTETDSIYKEAQGSVEIGELSPLAYRKLCPDVKVEYFLKNATQYLKVHGNILRTNASSTIDHDSYNPGPLLLAAVNCVVQKYFNSAPVTYLRVLRINVLDKNDNYPQIHNGNFEQRLLDPHFQAVSEIN